MPGRELELAVQPDEPSAELGRQAVGTGLVGRPHGMGQSVRSGVRDPRRLGFVPEGDREGDRPEDLGARADVRGLAPQDDRTHEVAGRQVRQLGRAALEEHLGTFGQATVEEVRHAVALALVDERSHPRAADQAVAKAQAAELARRDLDERIEVALLDQPPRRRAAHLSRVQAERPGQAGRDRGHVHVIEDDGRALAAKLELDRHEVRPACRAHLATCLGRPGERHAGDPRARRERHAGRRPGAGDHVQDARRQAGLEREVRQGQDRERCVDRRLDHDRVARGERRRHAPAEEQQRRVPRHDERADAIGLAQLVGTVSGDRQVLAVRGVAGDGRVVAQGARQLRHVVTGRVARRLALVERFDLPQRLAVLVDDVREPLEQVGSLRRAHRAPGLAEGSLRGRDGRVHVLGSRFEQGRERLARRRVERRRVRRRPAGRTASPWMTKPGSGSRRRRVSGSTVSAMLG